MAASASVFNARVLVAWNKDLRSKLQDSLQKTAAILVACIQPHQIEEVDALSEILRARRLLTDFMLLAEGEMTSCSEQDTYTVTALYPTEHAACEAALLCVEAIERHNAYAPRGRALDVSFGIDHGEMIVGQGEVFGDAPLIATALAVRESRPNEIMVSTEVCMAVSTSQQTAGMTSIKGLGSQELSQLTCMSNVTCESIDVITVPFTHNKNIAYFRLRGFLDHFLVSPVWKAALDKMGTIDSDVGKRHWSLRYNTVPDLETASLEELVIAYERASEDEIANTRDESGNPEPPVSSYQVRDQIVERYSAEEALLIVSLFDFGGLGKRSGPLHAMIMAVTCRALAIPLIQSHNGTIASMSHGRITASFADPVAAARCALEMRADICSYNTGIKPAQKLSLCVGVHHGYIFNNAREMVGYDAVFGEWMVSCLKESTVAVVFSEEIQTLAGPQLDCGLREEFTEHQGNIVRVFWISDIAKHTDPSLTAEEYANRRLQRRQESLMNKLRGGHHHGAQNAEGRKSGGIMRSLTRPVLFRKASSPATGAGDRGSGSRALKVMRSLTRPNLDKRSRDSGSLDPPASYRSDSRAQSSSISQRVSGLFRGLDVPRRSARGDQHSPKSPTGLNPSDTMVDSREEGSDSAHLFPNTPGNGDLPPGLQVKAATTLNSEAMARIQAMNLTSQNHSQNHLSPPSNVMFQAPSPPDGVATDSVPPPPPTELEIAEVTPRPPSDITSVPVPQPVFAAQSHDITPSLSMPPTTSVSNPGRVRIAGPSTDISLGGLRTPMAFQTLSDTHLLETPMEEIYDESTRGEPSGLVPPATIHKTESKESVSFS